MIRMETVRGILQILFILSAPCSAVTKLFVAQLPGDGLTWAARK